AAAVAETRRTLADFQSIFTDDHPDVVAARRNFELAKSRYDEAARAAAEGDNEQRRVDSEIAWLQQSAKDFRERMDEVMERIDRTPAVGARLSAIDRDYDAIREKYQTLLSRRVEAELAR